MIRSYVGCGSLSVVMRVFALAVAVVALAACGSPTAPSITTTAGAVPATATTSDHDGGEDAGSISVRIVSQEHTGPCVIHVGRIPTADPAPIPHDGEDYADVEWCVESTAWRINATAEVSSTDHPEIDAYDGLGDFSKGCHVTRTYWTTTFPDYDQVHISVTAGLLHDQASCGLRY
jgi:hypothetical protein